MLDSILKPVKILKIDKVHRKEVVYNIGLSKDNMYFANGFLVHNCEYYDGRIFEVEVARKIVKDITTFGVPKNDKQIDKFKALRPWVSLDRSRAREGKSALFYLDPKGKKIFLPNSKVTVNADGTFSSIGANKGKRTTRQIIETAPKGGNPPVMPPLHGSCRSTLLVTEELITEEV